MELGACSFGYVCVRFLKCCASPELRGCFREAPVQLLFRAPRWLQQLPTLVVPRGKQTALCYLLDPMMLFYYSSRH